MARSRPSPRDTSPQGRAFALVFLVMQNDEAGDPLGKPASDGEARVLGAIVDDDELEVQALVADGDHFVEARLERLFLVVAGNDEAQLHRWSAGVAAGTDAAASPTGCARWGAMTAAAAGFASFNIGRSWRHFIAQSLSRVIQNPRPSKASMRQRIDALNGLTPSW